jgi:hypothetical protein
VAEAGLRVLTDPALWGVHHDLTGPVPLSWPEALDLLSTRDLARVFAGSKDGPDLEDGMHANDNDPASPLPDDRWSPDPVR